jgi:hypothetical protein
MVRLLRPRFLMVRLLRPRFLTARFLTARFLTARFLMVRLLRVRPLAAGLAWAPGPQLRRSLGMLGGLGVPRALPRRPSQTVWTSLVM